MARVTTRDFVARTILTVAAVVFVSGCTQSRQTVPMLQVTPGPIAKQSQQSILPESPPAKKIIRKEPRRSPETDPELAVVAQKKIKQAKKLYSTGNYDQAETLLKESITTFPFLAQAQLTLGKIFLIKGSAARDMALLNSARLMFEMARAIDPGSAEVQTLLELFTTQYPE